MSDPCPVVLYDSGHAHPVVRGVAAVIGSIAGLLSIDTLLSWSFGISVLNGQYPHGKLIALGGMLALTLFCFFCVIGRRQILFDRPANIIILRGPALYWCHDFSKIASVVLRHGWVWGGVWTIELRKTDGGRCWLTQETDEVTARELALRIGEALGKPVE